MGALRSAEGHVGDAWDNPNLVEVAISKERLLSMSEQALGRTGNKGPLQLQELDRKLRRERKLQLRAERAYRMQRSTPLLMYH
jgi:hypothetical protein